jgi:hypothetical protein
VVVPVPIDIQGSGRICYYRYSVQWSYLILLVFSAVVVPDTSDILCSGRNGYYGFSVQELYPLL